MFFGVSGLIPVHIKFNIVIIINGHSPTYHLCYYYNALMQEVR